MELEVKLKCSAKEVFEELISSIQEDIKNSTTKKVAREKITENYSYNKKLVNYTGSSVEVTVTIDKLIYPNEYSATITSPKGANTIGYTLSEGEDGTNIVYKEKYVTKSIFQKANNMFMSLLFTKKNKKRMIRNFEYLEKQIIDKRK